MTWEDYAAIAFRVLSWIAFALCVVGIISAVADRMSARISPEPVHRVDYLPRCCPARAGETWVCVDEAGVREERVAR